MNHQITLFSGREPPDTFKKAVQVIHSRPLSQLSMVQRKILNVWLRHAGMSTPDKDGWWELRVDAMSREINFNSKNTSYLKESAEALMRIVFQWDVIAPEIKRVRWKASVLFPDVEIMNEVVRYRISDQLRDQVLSPAMYAWIDQGVLRKYRRAASIGIYEHCMRFSKLGRTATVPWQEFRDIIMGESSELTTYKQYKFFKAKILLPSIEEINKEGALNIKLMETVSGRSVVGVYFLVTVPNASKEIVFVDDDAVELIGKMVRMGVPNSEAKRLNSQYSHDAINAALAYTNDRRANKKAEKLTNAAAYFRKALSEKWVQHTTVEEEISDAVDKTEVRKTEPKKDINAMFQAKQMSNAEKYFLQLDLDEQTALITRYNEQQSVVGLTIKAKTTKPSQTAFQLWLARDLWGVPETAEIIKFAESLLERQTAGVSS